MRSIALTRRREFAPQIVTAQPQNLRPTFPATLQLPTGVTENRVTGRTEGNPNGMVVDYPLNTGGTVHNNVDTEAKLRTALQAVAASSTNDIIVLTADFEVAPTFSFPDRATANLRCDIVSAAVYAGTFPKSGSERVSPSDAGIVTLTRALSANGNGLAAFDFGRAAGRNTGLSSGWRFIGIQFRTHPSQTQLPFYFFMAGSEGAAQSDTTKIPQNIIFDRCVFFGGSLCENKGALFFGAKNSAVRNCYFYHWWAFSGTWNDVSAVVSWNTVGGNVIENNYLDASGENMMIGGGVQYVGNSVDWVFRRNHVEKDYALYHGKGAGLVTIKNLSETKQVSRYVVEDNYFINSWHESSNSQDGAALVWKMQDYGSPGHDAVSDNLLFRGNYVRNFAIVANLLGDQGSPEDAPNQLGEVHFIDNIFDGWHEAPFTRTPRGIVLSGPGTPAPPAGANNYGNLSFSHNTIVGSGNYSNGNLVTFANTIANASIPSFVFEHNVCMLTQYGISGTPGEGTGSLNTYCATYSVTGNTFVRTFGNNTALYPSGNSFATALSDLYDANDITSKTWRLSATYVNRLASDGFTRGVSDYDWFMSRLAGVL